MEILGNPRKDNLFLFGIFNFLEKKFKTIQEEIWGNPSNIT